MTRVGIQNPSGNVLGLTHTLQKYPKNKKKSVEQVEIQIFNYQKAKSKRLWSAQTRGAKKPPKTSFSQRVFQ